MMPHRISGKIVAAVVAAAAVAGAATALLLTGTSGDPRNGKVLADGDLAGVDLLTEKVTEVGQDKILVVRSEPLPKVVHADVQAKLDEALATTDPATDPLGFENTLSEWVGQTALSTGKGVVLVAQVEASCDGAQTYELLWSVYASDLLAGIPSVDCDVRRDKDATLAWVRDLIASDELADHHELFVLEP